MLIRKWLPLCLCSVLLIGCGDTDTATPSATGGNAVADRESDPGNGADEFEPLELPDGVSDQLKRAYQQTSNSLSPDGVLQFARVSQAIGGELSQAGDETGYAFFKQSAQVARRARDEGAQVDAEMYASFAYNEACALAKEGNTDAAMAALGDAMKHGFSDMKLIESDDDIESLRSLSSFSGKLEEWKVAAKEYHAAKIAKLLEGETFPFDFTLEDTHGVEQSLAALRGKVVIVDFWGTWCGPCVREIPSFIKLQDKYGPDGFQIIGINFERGNSAEKNLEKVVKFAKARGINYPCVMGDPNVKNQVPDFRGYPTTLFIDKTGKVRMKVVGAHDFEYLDSVVAALMEETPTE